MKPIFAFLIILIAGLHLFLTLLSSFALIGLELPFVTAAILCLLLTLVDRTLFVVFSAFLLCCLIFLSPMVFFDLRVASYSFRGDDVYDQGLMRALYWFIGMFPALYLWGTPRLQGFDHRNSGIAKTDAAPVIAGFILIAFSMIMLRNGTIVEASYREVSVEAGQASYIEFASLFTLLGFCCAVSPFARRFLIICACIYMLSCLLVGFRLRFLAILLVTICCTWGVFISARWKVGGLALAVFLFWLGFVRNLGFLGESPSLEAMALVMLDRGAVDSTFGGAFQTSKFHAFYIDTVAATKGLNGLYFLMGDFLSIFMTRSGTPGDLEIKTATQAYFTLPGGGLLPGFFFAYGGLAASVVLSALFIAFTVWIVRSPIPAFLPFKILMIAYAPRTLFYDWVVAFKMMFIFSVFALLIQFFARAVPWRGDAPPLIARPNQLK